MTPLPSWALAVLATRATHRVLGRATPMPALGCARCGQVLTAAEVLIVAGEAVPVLACPPCTPWVVQVWTLTLEDLWAMLSQATSL